MLTLAQNLNTANDAKLAKVSAAFHIALCDVRNAFVAFLAQRKDKMRPFIVAGHSQGSVLMAKVIKDCIEGSNYEDLFVAAYLAGGTHARSNSNQQAYKGWGA